MKKINTLRYTGSNHTSLVAFKKNNPELPGNFEATSLSEEESNIRLKTILAENLSEGDNPISPEEVELVITEVDRKKFTSLTTEKLLKLYEKTEKLLGAKEIMESILTKRGALTPEEEPENPVEGETEEKPVREYKKCMTEECLQARLAEARTNYKKFCKFLCTKDKEEHLGIIRSARLDKRSGFIQYRIEIIEKPTEDATIYTERTGKIYGKGDDSKDLTIFEETPAEIQLGEKTEEPAQVKENTAA